MSHSKILMFNVFEGVQCFFLELGEMYVKKCFMSTMSTEESKNAAFK